MNIIQAGVFVCNETNMDELRLLWKTFQFYWKTATWTVSYINSALVCTYKITEMNETPTLYQVALARSSLAWTSVEKYYQNRWVDRVHVFKNLLFVLQGSVLICELWRKPGFFLWGACHCGGSGHSLLARQNKHQNSSEILLITWSGVCAIKGLLLCKGCLQERSRDDLRHEDDNFLKQHVKVENVGYRNCLLCLKLFLRIL